MRSLMLKVNAILVLVAAGVILGLLLAWDLWTHAPGLRGESDRQALAAELLAHGLPREAAALLEAEIEADPTSARGIRLSRALAEIQLDSLGDSEKALATLVRLRLHDPAQASATEPLVRRCMDRLGRVYDVQRRLLLEKGQNPLVSDISSGTAVRVGNRQAISISEIERRLAQVGQPTKSPPKEVLDRVVNQMSGEFLMRRAAERSGIRRDPGFLDQVRQFEENLALQKWLEEHVLKDVHVDEQALALYLQQHKSEFQSPLRVVHSVLAFADEPSARAFVAGTPTGSAPAVVLDHVSATPEELPPALKAINWEKDPVKGNFGPIEVSGRWLVYPIHEIVPARHVPPDLARQQARLRLLEEKQGTKISETVAELARKEELVKLDEVLRRHFAPAEGGNQPQPPVGGR